VVRWEIRHITDGAVGNGAEPLCLGEEVYFDGRPWGSPEIRGTVVEVEQVNMDGSFQPLYDVTISGVLRRDSNAKASP
jgi:hypothetical protein